MPHPNPIPLQNLIRDEGELAVWHSAFGAAYATCLLRSAAAVQCRLGGPEECTHRRAVEPALVECTPVPLEAQLIAEAAVLQYRGIAS